MLKILSWSVFITLILLSGTYFWIKNFRTDVLPEKEFNKLISEISTTKPLPNNFQKTIAQIYPDIFDNNYSKHLLLQLLSNKEFQPCPCRNVALRVRTENQNVNQAVRNLYPVSLTWAIEERVSQKQCMAYNLSNFDFTKGIIGIDQASDYYFNENLANLSTNQLLELILMIKNPLLYDKERRPAIFNEELKILKSKIND